MFNRSNELQTLFVLAEFVSVIISCRNLSEILCLFHGDFNCTFAVVVNAISATTNVAIAVVFSLYFQKFKNGFPSKTSEEWTLFSTNCIEVNYMMARYPADVTCHKYWMYHHVMRL
ncbi:hypothetical protein C8J55DRAFT_490335 [Lentinula edodes]|uniref:Uncharacterized protein n=1 Tax=Lentinula lateritia TaxID=40482 RepID=A0A9W9A889_9AGAR|nr:hypothetical protein C8J55DRAFT_490335 [Lentinula edodes]